MDDQEEGQWPSTEVEDYGGPLSEAFGLPGSVEQQRATTEVDCHGGPTPEVSGPPKATIIVGKRGAPFTGTHPATAATIYSETLSPPTAVISDSTFEEWLQSDNMEMLMFFQSEEPQ